MIAWVAQAAARALGKENVYVATDDQRIKTTVLNYGFQAIMTPSDVLTGTDRVAYAAMNIPADIYLNIQGDEPLLSHDNINKIIEEKKMYPDFVINAMAKITKEEDPHSVNLPKVVFNEDFQLVYMSRLPVPGTKRGMPDNLCRYKQVCIYAFSQDQLKKFYQLQRKSALEQAEDIEILRFLELGIPVRMCEVESGALAVDIPEDVSKVEIALTRLYPNE